MKKPAFLFTVPLVLFFLFLFVPLDPFLKYVVLIVGILSALVILSFVIAPAHVSYVSMQPVHARAPLGVSSSVTVINDPPAIPRTVRAILATMDATQFELFSAAVIIGLREGHRFDRHCGGSGDQGVDVKLRNALNLPVGVQSKAFAPGITQVGSPEIREFIGSLHYHNAVYGYFVTTSTFTKAARQVIEKHSVQVRVIDG